MIADAPNRTAVDQSEELLTHYRALLERDPGLARNVVCFAEQMVTVGSSIPDGEVPTIKDFLDVLLELKPRLADPVYVDELTTADVRVDTNGTIRITPRSS